MSEEQPTEEKIDPTNVITFGFDKEGFLNVRIHLKHGVSAMLGLLTEAQFRVYDQFSSIEKVQREAQLKNKGLIRPDGIPNGFRNRWR